MPGLSSTRMTETPITRPIKSEGAMACATRRVGGDQSASRSLSAWRRTKIKAPIMATRLIAIQNSAKVRPFAIFNCQPPSAAMIPTIPT